MDTKLFYLGICYLILFSVQFSIRVPDDSNSLFVPFLLILLQPLHEELYNSHPSAFLVPSFIKAVSEKTEESLRNIMSEPSPGVYIFSMLQPRFCELLLSEVLMLSCLIISFFSCKSYCACMMRVCGFFL